MRFLGAVCFVTCLFAQAPVKQFIVANPGPHADPLVADPAHYRLDAETFGIRVVRLKLGPDETASVASFRDAVAVCIDECHIRLRAMLGGSADVHMETGATRVIGAGKRFIVNLSTKPVEVLFIERKIDSSPQL